MNNKYYSRDQIRRLYDQVLNQVPVGCEFTSTRRLIEGAKSTINDDFYDTYCAEQFLDQILMNIPANNPKFTGLRKFVEKKRSHICDYI